MWIPLFYRTQIGGTDKPLFTEFQISFPGKGFIEVSTLDALVLNLEYRFRFSDNHFASGLVNAGIYSEKLKDFDLYTGIGSFGTKYMYKSVIGPLQFTITYSLPYNKINSHISLGYIF